MAEWFKAHAWKVCVPKRYRGFESHSLRQILVQKKLFFNKKYKIEKFTKKQPISIDLID